MLFKNSVSDYTIFEKSIHSILTAGLWAISIVVIVHFSRKVYNYPEQRKNDDKICPRERLITLLCFSGCKLITFIDWHTLKIIREFQKRNLFSF